ncbi:cytochrome P450 [bacterium]|nr:cytochrome P450 [bacterium]
MSIADTLDVQDIDLGDLELWEDGPPYAIFARLRREAPVHWSPFASRPDETGFWSITRAADVRQISMDWQTFSSERGGVAVLDDIGIPVEMQRQQMISMDPPRHDRVKALFQKAFTPKRIAEHEAMIRQITRHAIDTLAARGSGDLVSDVGAVVTARVIGSLLGTPENLDSKLIEWANIGLAWDDTDLRKEWGQMGEMLAEAAPILHELISERRSRPSADLLSALAQAEVDGDKFDDVELLMMFGLLLSAGTDSTKSVYTSGMHALIERPEQMEWMAVAPERIPSAVEEILRCFPAFAHFRRTANRDVEMHGETIRAGDKVLLWFVSSNRDETIYEDPERFDVRRPVVEHQAFGAGGRHFCLGAPLARLELKVLFEETISRLHEFELVDKPKRTRGMFLNQFKSLPVRFKSK